MMKSEIYKPNTFLYFSYGGNMSTFRIHMHTPTAEFVSIARLDVSKQKCKKQILLLRLAIATVFKSHTYLNRITYLCDLANIAL